MAILVKPIIDFILSLAFIVGSCAITLYETHLEGVGAARITISPKFLVIEIINALRILFRHRNKCFLINDWLKELVGEIAWM